ncbi:MAG: putative Ig domain-containing protein, partial [Bdellovibrionales bacterium]|nr:putative Ig domain-containing protein [Bdellovibrionales bacterium]
QTGLTLNSDCSISGTPTVNHVPGTAFSVTPSSLGGATQAGLTVNIRVNDMAPAISFSPSYTRTVGAIAAITPTAGGGTVISCTNATLTADTGLTLNSDCSVTGTATTAIPSTPYLLVATSTGGLTQNVTLTLKIDNVAPVLGAYANTTLLVNSGAGLPISPASLTGGTPVTCTASPTLPAGMSINSSTCVITGTPTAIQVPAVTHTITATALGGLTGTSTIQLLVRNTPPTLSFSNAPFTGGQLWRVGTAVTNASATTGGGTITNCTAIANPDSLPAGLSVNPLTCAITGSPTTRTAANGVVRIRAESAGGFAEGSYADADITFKVNAALPTFTYSAPSSSPYTIRVGTAVNVTLGANITGTANTTLSGCAMTGTPAGLSVDGTTCAISGTATTYSPLTPYNVSFNNADGESGSTIVGLLIQDLAPSMVYAASYTWTVGNAVNVAPANTGGTIVSCAVQAGSLPAGVTLAVSGNSCALSGTPTATDATASMTIRATAQGGLYSDYTFDRTVDYPTPTVTSVSPKMGLSAGGTAITITGTGFYAGASVNLEVSATPSACASITVVNPTTITCTTPANPGGAAVVSVADIKVTNAGPTATGTLASGFYYLGAPSLWLRADAGVTLTASKVSTWADQSGNANDATQATAADRPIVTTGFGTNNSDAISFDGSSDFLTLAGLGMANNIAGATVAMAQRHGSVPASTTQTFLGISANGATGGTGTYRLNFRAISDAGATGCQNALQSDTDDNGAGASITPAVGPTVLYGSNFAHVTRANFANAAGADEMLVKSSGVAEATNTTLTFAANATNATNSAAINLGRRTNGSQFYNGDIAEVLFYGRKVTDAERDVLMQYYNARYGTAL